MFVQKSFKFSVTAISLSYDIRSAFQNEQHFTTVGNFRCSFYALGRALKPNKLFRFDSVFFIHLTLSQHIESYPQWLLVLKSTASVIT